MKTNDDVRASIPTKEKITIGRWLKSNAVVCLLMIFTLLSTMLFRQFGMKEYAIYNTQNLHYEKGRVIQITSNDLRYNEDYGIYTGTQELVVELLEGEHKGQTIELTNYLTSTHNVLAKVNSMLIINVDAPEYAAPYYTVYSYDRSLPLTVCILILFAAILGVGGKKGFKAIAALVYSMFLIVYLMLPMIYSGYSPVVASLICAALSTAVTLLFLNGQSKKTCAAILATMSGLLAAAGLFWLVSAMLRINGFSSDSAESLILIQQRTGLKIKEVLFAGVLIASLGAIMDVAMSIVSSLYEIHHHSSEITEKALFRSGMEIGKDMIGTMTNTLILAFTGSAFVTLLIFTSYQVQFSQLWNSNYLAIEIAQGICGTFGIVATVPAAAAITAIIIKRSLRPLKEKL